ncbi:NTF2-like protein [Exidia glandulosa HHB12029]|uniref:NTF2-like protein n=1 Tax=Exidia glandulosa HHB12029 TaxID=1314781 RepID=A0A165JVC2_EXIGL|nr:NTF2-like protein [Exidia glandulosa HHB12029]
MNSSPSTPAPRSARHAFRNAVRGVLDQDEKMKDVAPSSSHTARRSAAPYSKRVANPDAMQVERPSGARTNGSLSSRIGSSRLSVTGRVARVGDPRVIAASSSRMPAHEMWREFVKSRYNPQARFLDLSRISEDAIVKKHRLIAPGQPGSTGKEAPTIFKLAGQLKPEPLTISLANNGLTSSMPLATLQHYLPGIRNLSLENNELKTWKDIDAFSSRKGRLLKLRELILIGNPLREVEYQHGRGERYTSEIARRFPSLEILDGNTIAKITFDAPSTSKAEAAAAAALPEARSFPVGVNPGVVPPEVQSLVGEFLTRFFNYFDTSRASLAPIYAPEATFSFSANTTIPQRARVMGLHATLPNQRKLDFAKWLQAGSRNLSRVGGRLEAAMEALHMGTAQIGEVLAAMPATRHDLGKPSDFVVDACTVMGAPAPGGVLLMISVHGQFTEVEVEGVRSFDRSFVLAPSTEGSPAQQAGWPVVILSDQLVVRHFSSPDAWTPGPLKVQFEPTNAPPPPTQIPQQLPVAQPVAVPVDAILASLPEHQRVLVMEVSARTGLVTQYAGQCLEGNGWDLGRALANFEQVKAQLPREAFAR